MRRVIIEDGQIIDDPERIDEFTKKVMWIDDLNPPEVTRDLLEDHNWQARRAKFAVFIEGEGESKIETHFYLKPLAKLSLPGACGKTTYQEIWEITHKTGKMLYILIARVAYWDETITSYAIKKAIQNLFS